jgi:hypothetical protein
MFFLRKPAVAVALTLALLASAGFITFLSFIYAGRDEPEQTCGRGCWKYNHVALHEYLSAELAYFEQTARKKGSGEFWRGELADLPPLDRPDGSKVPIADLVPENPHAGYWYQALRFADEDRTVDPKRFAACAFPVQYGKGTRHTYVIDHEGRLFRKDTVGKPPPAYPANPAEEGWVLVK